MRSPIERAVKPSGPPQGTSMHDLGLWPLTEDEKEALMADYFSSTGEPGTLRPVGRSVPNEKLRALVEKWRKGYGPGGGDFYAGADAGLQSAADALEDLLDTLEDC